MMRKIKYFLIGLFSFLTKSYTVMNDVAFKSHTGGIERLEYIDLTKFNFYKREIYFDENLPLYKGPQSIRNGNSMQRYEIQLMAIEKNTAESPRVLYFNYIPPYRTRNGYIYNLPPFHEPRLVNLQYINYLYFGKIANNHISFQKEKFDLHFTISESESEVTINSVNFLDRGTVKEVPTAPYLKNTATFKRIYDPLIVLHKFEGRSLTDNYTNYLEPSDVMYYDCHSHNVYFHFSKSLHKEYDGRWIRFSHRRVKAEMRD